MLIATGVTDDTGSCILDALKFLKLVTFQPIEQAVAEI